MEVTGASTVFSELSGEINYHVQSRVSKRILHSQNLRHDHNLSKQRFYEMLYLIQGSLSV